LLLGVFVVGRGWSGLRRSCTRPVAHAHRSSYAAVRVDLIFAAAGLPEKSHRSWRWWVRECCAAPLPAANHEHEFQGCDGVMRICPRKICRPFTRRFRPWPRSRLGNVSQPFPGCKCERNVSALSRPYSFSSFPFLHSFLFHILRPSCVLCGCANEKSGEAWSLELNHNFRRSGRPGGHLALEIKKHDRESTKVPSDKTAISGIVFTALLRRVAHLRIHGSLARRENSERVQRTEP
jgi:hypothetical protein